MQPAPKPRIMLSKLGKIIKNLAHSLLIVLLLFLCGCNEAVVVNDLDQKQSQEIVATLAEQGIAAKINKEKGAKGKFSILVPAINYSEAVSILHYNNLPKEYEPSLSDILESKGFLPNSRELEALRVERALAAELESIIKVMPAVAEVKAVVRRASFSGVGPPAPTQLSVLITKKPEFELKREDVQALIINLVQGVSQQSMVIEIQDMQSMASMDRVGISRNQQGKKVAVPMRTFLGWFRVAHDDYDKLILGLSVGLSLFLLVGLVVGFSFGFLGRRVVSQRPTDNLTALPVDRSALRLSAREKLDDTE
jgi:type III secretory pathway lipoprotein EscJ